MSSDMVALAYLLVAILVGLFGDERFRGERALLCGALGIALCPVSPATLPLWDISPALGYLAWGGLSAVTLLLISAASGRLRGRRAVDESVSRSPLALVAGIACGAGFAVVFGATSYIAFVSRLVIHADFEVTGLLWTTQLGYRELNREWLALAIKSARSPVLLALTAAAVGAIAGWGVRRASERVAIWIDRTYVVAMPLLVGGALLWLLYCARHPTAEKLIPTLIHAYDWAFAVAALSVTWAIAKPVRSTIGLAVAVGAVAAVAFADLVTDKSPHFRKDVWDEQRNVFLAVEASLGAAVAIAASRSQLWISEVSGRRLMAGVVLGGAVMAGCVALQVDGRNWLTPWGLQGWLAAVDVCAESPDVAGIEMNARHGWTRTAEDTRRELDERSAMALFLKAPAPPKVVHLLAHPGADATRLIDSLAVTSERGYSVVLMGEHVREVEPLTVPPFRLATGGHCAIRHVALTRLASGERPPASARTVEQLLAWLAHE